MIFSAPGPGQHGQLKSHKGLAFQTIPIDTTLLDQNATELANISVQIDERLLRILTQDCCFWNLA